MTRSDENDIERERRVNVIMFVLALVLSAFRFGKCVKPFDFGDKNTIEYLTKKNQLFVNDPESSPEQAHGVFLQEMFRTGWRYGKEDFSLRTHCDLLPWNQLPQEAKDLYAFCAIVLKSAGDFYGTLRNEIESELWESIATAPIGVSGERGEPLSS